MISEAYIEDIHVLSLDEVEVEMSDNVVLTHEYIRTLHSLWRSRPAPGVQKPYGSRFPGDPERSKAWQLVAAMAAHVLVLCLTSAFMRTRSGTTIPFLSALALEWSSPWNSDGPELTAITGGHGL